MLDAGRQADIRDIESTLRNSNNLKDVSAARRALDAIKREQSDSKILSRRQWMMNEIKHGRIENVRGIQSEMRENTDKRGQVY